MALRWGTLGGFSWRATNANESNNTPVILPMRVHSQLWKHTGFQMPKNMCTLIASRWRPSSKLYNYIYIYIYTCIPRWAASQGKTEPSKSDASDKRTGHHFNSWTSYVWWGGVLGVIPSHTHTEKMRRWWKGLVQNNPCVDNSWKTKNNHGWFWICCGCSYLWTVRG